MSETPGPRPLVAPADVVDVFVYVVVLNLVAEYLPQVITETFTVSLLTAAVLKVVLELVLLAKDHLKARFKAAHGMARKVASGLLLWVTLAGSKFLVLELIDLLFGDAVHLGGFWSVTGLILSLMLARSGVRRLLSQND